MELGLEALFSHSKEALFNMILWNHRTRSYEQAEKVIEDLLTLPFNEDLKAHFR
jgi:alpha-galactosidase/6-phospho-beta-glucosidase family protein